MTNKELDDYIKTVNPDFNSHIEKGTIEMNNEYYNLLEEKIARFINQNQELKEKLDKYENPEDMTLMMMWCTEKVKDENKKLNEEITNLSKDVDMWNAKYNDMFDENKRLKEALEVKSYCKYANKCDEFNDCSREEYEDMANANMKLSIENCDLKDKNKELKKQVETYEIEGYEQNEELNKMSFDIRKYKVQQKEFINYLNSYIYLLNDKPDMLEETQKDILEEILQKYKEIINKNS